MVQLKNKLLNVCVRFQKLSLLNCISSDQIKVDEISSHFALFQLSNNMLRVIIIYNINGFSKSDPTRGQLWKIDF